MCKIYGISGANGNYPCLWCLTKKSEIQYKRGPQPERTLSSLSTDNKRFMNVGKGDKKNSIHEPILDIPLDRVTPPYLHCLLGITKRHHTLLEDAADEIDRMVFTDDATKTEQIEEILQYGGNYLTVTDMKKKLNFTRTCQTVSYNQ